MNEAPPIPEVSDLDMAFPTRWKTLLPPWDELTDDERHYGTIYCEAAERLMFNGGTLEDHGVRIRDGVDAEKVYRYLKATLGDFGPKHEHKIGGIGHMLAKWCEPIKKEGGAS